MDMATTTKKKPLPKKKIFYDESEGAAEGWRTYRSNLDEALAANRHSDAIVLFMKMVGVPDDMITSVKNSSMWPGLEAIAPTLRYDAAAMGDDRSAPVDRAVKVKTQTLVMDGGASFQMVPFMRATAEKLAKTIPNAQRRTIEGQGHDISPDALAPVLIEFFSTE